MVEVCFSFAELGMLASALKKEGKDILCLYDSLDVGDISGDFENARRNFYVYGSNGLVKVFKRNLKYVVKQAKKGEDIRIWRSVPPYSMCGFLYLMDMLDGVDCNIIDANLPNSILGWPDDIDEEPRWSFADAEVVAKHEKNLNKILTKEERKIFSNQWKQLVIDNAPLRINMDGKLVGVDDTYFDEFIESCIPDDDTFKMSKLVGTAMGTAKRCLTLDFIVSRVETMISQGKLEVVEGPIDKDHNLSKILRRCM